ncbi:MAG: hypothetical protein HYU78_05075 [Rhodocyclales bacterium]|nr:hypothetical protein [Rhodocyclales bacterium]
MRSLFAVSLFLPALALAAASPLESVTATGESIPQRMVSLSVKEDVAASDARVLRAREQMARAIRNTGETEQAVAAACTRAARFIFDSTKSPATSIEVLDALAEKGAGRAMSDSIGRYVEARRNSPGKTHAEAIAAMK